ncbi:uncharacterized protein LAESUDRAFT_718228 [Laetiporus sulphureus 93-53]|uniref:Uncharacterized protein n=1 Tax=Laetiporus sulphureus 93-53 TaxID=1314785 RepID=A0A165B5W5_9APHY|nr:uncharacterized protein LAESUDRAFT_718228 [Laetiporus sulphureus 93-53]KZT00309.1 hypothetical protein LAESUDRAFT_718228 [Laetiporus sulphureus 93-53]
MFVKQVNQRLKTMLYTHRFFPYHVYNLLGGIEEDGSGAVYTFNPVGSYEHEACRATGAAQSLVQPFLDNQAYVPSCGEPEMSLPWIYHKNQLAAPGTTHPAHLLLLDVPSIVIDSFTSATERYIEVGGGLEMYVVLANGRSAQGLASINGLAKITTKAEGDRMFVIRELKKD